MRDALSFMNTFDVMTRRDFMNMLDCLEAVIKLLWLLPFETEIVYPKEGSFVVQIVVNHSSRLLVGRARSAHGGF